jgi:hypothetical protein
VLTSIDKLPTRYMTTSSAEIAEAQRMDGHARAAFAAGTLLPDYAKRDIS